MSNPAARGTQSTPLHNHVDMTGSRIVLTGPTGGLGREVLKHILPLVPREQLIVTSPSPARVHDALSDLSAVDVEVREADYTLPTTLPKAFAGADALFLVSYPSVAHEVRVNAHIAAIDAAKAAGIRRVIYTSLAFGGDSKAAVMRAHLDTEAYLKASGLEYTIIREGLYAESFPLYFGKTTSFLFRAAVANQTIQGSSTLHLTQTSTYPATVLSLGPRAQTWAKPQRVSSRVGYTRTRPYSYPGQRRTSSHSLNLPSSALRSLPDQ